MGIRCGSPQWLLVAAVALLFTAAAFPGDVVTVTNSQEYSNAFRNSSVGTIILANDMKLDPVDWQEYNYNSPYHLKRNLTVQGDNSTDRWMVGPAPAAWLATQHVGHVWPHSSMGAEPQHTHFHAAGSGLQCRTGVQESPD